MFIDIIGYSRFMNDVRVLTDWEGRTGEYLARSQDVGTEGSEVLES